MTTPSDSATILRDFPHFAKSLLKIKTKDRRIVPFVLNGEQEIIWEAIKSQLDENDPVRIATCKPRQVGASTLCQGLCWWKLTTQENTHALSIAHETKATQRIFSMSQVFFDYMPMKPMRRYSTRQEIVLENADDYARIDNPGLRSRLELGTAGKMGTGRSATVHVLHCSEIAQWPYPEELIGGLFPSVPYEPNTMILMESTAHGAGEYWHEFWQECKNGENQFIPVFIPWFTVKEYQLSPEQTARWMVKRGYDEEEKRLRRIFKISDERLAWRRMRINEFKGNEDSFREEYPADDVECWVVAGNPIFDTHRLLTALEKCRKPQIGYLDPNLAWRADRKGPISVWRHPVADGRYTIGVDVALGVRGGDYSVVEVVDAGDEQCAEWHGHIDPISFAGEIEKLGRYYNNAVVAIEINNHGFSTQAELRKRYWNCYRWRFMDRFVDKLTDKIGWESNVKTKPLLIAHMSHLVREGDVGIRSKELVQEMMRFIETPSGGEAAAGCFDDRVMAFMIACYVNDVERPKGAGGSVTMPYDHQPPQSADADYALSHDLGQHLFSGDDEHDWRTM